MPTIYCDAELCMYLDEYGMCDRGRVHMDHNGVCFDEIEDANKKTEVEHLEAEVKDLKAENAKLREQVERLQPKDCAGNVLDIADTVSMLRSECYGDREWDDVVVELALTKWGGDRWIVCGSRGEAWACDCLKTGYDEDAYEDSDDAEPIANPTLMECENAKLRELVRHMYTCMDHVEGFGVYYDCENCALNNDTGECDFEERIRELGIEA